MSRIKTQEFRLGEVGASIHQRDALRYMKSLPAESVDLIITSPPYCMGMPYEDSVSAKDFVALHRRLLPEVERVLKPTGSVCWQVGHHVSSGGVIPLDALVFQAAAERTKLVLRNRIVWTFGHGSHAQRRFSGRHETALWFTKSPHYKFNLDPVRVPQKYPGKRAYKGSKKGEFSGNPLGKNPGDVWDIPNVKAKHLEKTAHPCQFPVALAQRFILSLTEKGDTVFDPFLGSGTTAIAALMNGRNFLGTELEPEYVEISAQRIQKLCAGDLVVRADIPPREPKTNESVAQKPGHFAVHPLEEPFCLT